MSSMPLPLAAAGDPGEDAVSSARYSSQASEEELRLWQHTFKQFDRDGGGDVDIAFDRADVDQNGSIDLAELTEAMAALGIPPGDLETARQTMARFDRDRDGALQRGEFRTLVQEVKRWRASKRG